MASEENKLSTNNQTEEIQLPPLPKSLPPYELLGSNVDKFYETIKELEEQSIDEPMLDESIEIPPPLPTTKPPLELFSDGTSIVQEEIILNRAMDDNNIAPPPPPPPPPPLPLSFGLNESNGAVRLKVRDKGNLTDGTGLNHVAISGLQQSQKEMYNELDLKVHARRAAIDKASDITEGYGKVEEKEPEPEDKKDNLFVNEEVKEIIENGLVPPPPKLPPVLFSQNSGLLDIKKDRAKKNEQQHQNPSNKEIQQNLAKEAIARRCTLRRVRVEQKIVDKNSNKIHDWTSTLKQSRTTTHIRNTGGKEPHTGFSYGQLARQLKRNVGGTEKQETRKRTVRQLKVEADKTPHTGFSYGQLTKQMNGNVGDTEIKQSQRTTISQLKDKANDIKNQNFFKPRKSMFGYEQRIMDSYNK